MSTTGGDRFVDAVALRPMDRYRAKDRPDQRVPDLGDFGLMPLSLYDVTVPSFLQMLGSIRALIDKAEQHCTAEGVAPEALIEARLIADMRPFAYQVKSVAVHSLGAIRSLPSGRFSPDSTTPPATFEAMRRRLDETTAALNVIEPDDIDLFEGRPMAFVAGEVRRDYLAEGFLLSFSMPNFYFHATTAYDILRMKGVPIGKRDFTGRQRTVTPAP